LPSYGPSILIAGPSSSGKSTIATGFLERLADQHYQFCIIDPEGDYEGLENAVSLGTRQRGPSVQEILDVFLTPGPNVVVNLIGLALADRPSFFIGLLPRLLELRARKGRPHWLIVDEAHHLLPAAWEPGTLAFPQDLKRTLFLTVHPEQVAPAALANVGVVVAVGKAPEDTIGRFCKAVQQEPPAGAAVALGPGEVLLWQRLAGQAPARVTIKPCRTVRHRHVRKYAEGELPPERSFYFRGPAKKLKLRAQNLMMFLQLGDGVDDETWLHHLRQGDYSKWFREAIKDDSLATEAAALEEDAALSADEGRAKLRASIERHYTLPASTPLPMPDTDAAPKG
jgi:hypothetical protein